MKLTSPDFQANEKISSKYTCDGENVNPPLEISDVPSGAQSLVLIMEDPDIPKEIKEKIGLEVFDHWVHFNIPPGTKTIKEGTSPVGISGNHTRGEAKYTGPCPPAEYEPSEHRYIFKLYALDINLNLPVGSTKTQVESSMQNHIIERAELIGRYKRIS
jgi:Raf kinase inhibitor-like YbhB/YbcL family protein